MQIVLVSLKLSDKFYLLGTPVRSKGKPSLEMVRSCNYQGEVMTTCKTRSHGTTPSSTNAEAMKEQVCHITEYATQTNRGKGCISVQYTQTTLES